MMFNKKKQSDELDKKVRERMNAAFEKANELATKKEIIEKNPLLSMLIASLFMMGVNAKDEGISAKELKETVLKFGETAAKECGKKDPLTDLMMLMPVMFGYKWAEENPMPE